MQIVKRQLHRAGPAPIYHIEPTERTAHKGYAEDQQFTLADNIIFGRSSKLFGAELDSNPGALGSTALD